MSTEASLQLPVDGAGQKLRMLRVYKPGDPDSTVELQEAVVLADADGNILGLVDGRSLPVADDWTRALLTGIALRLDFIAVALARDYHPPDELTS